MSCGLHHVGGITLRQPRAVRYAGREERAKHRHAGLETEIRQPEEIAKIAPITDLEALSAGLYRRRASGPSGNHHMPMPVRQNGRGYDRDALQMGSPTTATQ